MERLLLILERLLQMMVHLLHLKHHGNLRFHSSSSNRETARWILSWQV
jgi:hypothetical protein